jgi:AcrR family transcriptional regulator
MAMISETAGMSPGLIYRYFENKNAIILAIVEAQLEVVKSRISALRTTDDLAAALVDYFEPHEDDERNDSVNAPLFLEISAEATRDPEIRKAVRQIDQVVREATVEWLHRSPDEGGYGFPLREAKDRALALIQGAQGARTGPRSTHVEERD